MSSVRAAPDSLENLANAKADITMDQRQNRDFSEGHESKQTILM